MSDTVDEGTIQDLRCYIATLEAERDRLKDELVEQDVVCQERLNRLQETAQGNLDDRNEAEHREFTALKERDEARAESAKWERAARAMARVLRVHNVAPNPETGATRTESEWIDWSFTAVLSAPQAQGEEG